MAREAGLDRTSTGQLNTTARTGGISLKINGVGVDVNGVVFVDSLATTTAPSTFVSAGVRVTSDGAICVTTTDPGNTRLRNGIKVSAAGELFASTTAPASTAIRTYDPLLGSVLISADGALHVSNGAVAPASFSATLLSSLIPEVYTGSSTPTFTRATTAYVTDFEGLLKQVPSGASRHTGARYVRNLVSASNIPTGSWNAFSATDNGTIAGVGPNGEDAKQFTLTATSSAGLYKGGCAWDTNSHTYRITTLARIAPGSAAASLETWGPSGLSSDVVALTTSWRVLSRLVTGASGVAQCNLYCSGSVGSVIQVVWFQVEIVDGQTNQNPSEYVSVGVLSAPYHGAGVDGVKYFTTQNGNTVSSNVVTEATGAAISSATLLGYQAEGARTNLALQSQTFDVFATWSGGAGKTVTANSTTAPDGTTTADTLTSNAGAVDHRIIQSFTNSSATNTTSVYAKANGSSWIGISFDAATGQPQGGGAFFDVTNGTVGTVSAGATATITSADNGWYRCTVTKTSGVNSSFVIEAFASDNQAFNYNAAGTESVYIWGAQTEVASFASSYIPTTTVAVARNEDVLSYSSASNIDSTVGSLVFDTNITKTGGAQYFLGAGAAVRVPIFTNGSSLFGFDGTNNPNYGTDISNQTQTKLGVNWGSSTMKGFKSGVALTGGTFDNDFEFGANFRVGTGVSNQVIFGTIRNVAIYATKKTDAEMIALTA